MAITLITMGSSPSSPWSFSRFAAETFDHGLAFEPGEGWAYSNAGYMLLRQVAEDVTGTPYRVLISERVARPLGLKRTFVVESIGDLAALAPAVSCALSLDGSARDVRAHYHPGWVSHGVVASTASELARFLDGLFGGELLSRHALVQMTEWVAIPPEYSARPSKPGRGARRGNPGHGLGLMSDSASPWGQVAGHNGDGPGYRASAFHAFDLGGASVSAMCANEDEDAEGVVFDVLEQLATRGH